LISWSELGEKVIVFDVGLPPGEGFYDYYRCEAAPDVTLKVFPPSALLTPNREVCGWELMPSLLRNSTLRSPFLFKLSGPLP